MSVYHEFWRAIASIGEPHITLTEPAPDYLDDVIIRRLTRGIHCPTATRPEQAEAARILASRGHSDASIARRLRICPRTALRIRKRYGIPAGGAS